MPAGSCTWTGERTHSLRRASAIATIIGLSKAAQETLRASIFAAYSAAA
jgi:hypothetical protein